MKAGENLDERRFSRTVVADERDDFTAPDNHIQSAQHDARTIIFRHGHRAQQFGRAGELWYVRGEVHVRRTRSAVSLILRIIATTIAMPSGTSANPACAPTSGKPSLSEATTKAPMSAPITVP